MRTIIILTVLVISFGCAANKQISGNIRPYKSFAQYKGDTLKYLDDNFADNKQKYIGKKFKVLVHDLEFPILSCMSFNGQDMSHSRSLAITFCDDDEATDRVVFHRRSIFVYVYWQDMVSQDDIDKLDNGHPGIWTKEHQKYFGEKIMKDIKVVAYPEYENNLRKNIQK